MLATFGVVSTPSPVLLGSAGIDWHHWHEDHRVNPRYRYYSSTAQGAKTWSYCQTSAWCNHTVVLSRVVQHSAAVYLACLSCVVVFPLHYCRLLGEIFFRVSLDWINYEVPTLFSREEFYQFYSLICDFELFAFLIISKSNFDRLMGGLGGCRIIKIKNTTTTAKGQIFGNGVEFPDNYGLWFELPTYYNLRRA